MYYLYGVIFMSVKDRKNTVNFEDILKEFFNTKKVKKKEDKNLKCICGISSIEAKKGVKKDGIIKYIDVCDICKGTGKKEIYFYSYCDECNNKGNIIVEEDTFLGKFNLSKKCPNCSCEKCNGYGHVKKEEKISFELPPRTKNNDYLIFKNMGNRYKTDEQRGDLYINIYIYGSQYKRRGKRKGKMLNSKKEKNI